MTGYLLHGPQNGQFIQVNNVWPANKLYFPDSEQPDLRHEYWLDSILPLPAPLRGRIATYRYRRTSPKENK